MASLRRILPWLVLALYWPALFTGTHIPRMPQVQIARHDLALHFGAYMVLTVLYWLALYRRARPDWRRKAFYVVVGLMAAYGALDELSQTLVGRHCDVADWLADVSGALVGLGLLYALRSWRAWLVGYWGGLFVVTHWPFENAPWGQSPAGWTGLAVVLVVGAYAVLTVLWWRSWQKGGALAGRGLGLATLIVLPGYALLGELVSVGMGRVFEWGVLIGAWAGVLLGVVLAAVLARTRWGGRVAAQALAGVVGQEA